MEAVRGDRSGGATSPSPVTPGPRRHVGSHLSMPRDWAWRRRIRANPNSHRVYRMIVGALGLVVVLSGLVMVPFPGPGWLVVFLGVAVWASEFHWARRLHGYGMAKLRSWNDWVLAHGWPVRISLGLLTCAFVNAFVWASLRLTGIPAWVPGEVTAFLHAHLAL